MKQRGHSKKFLVFVLAAAARVSALAVGLVIVIVGVGIALGDDSGLFSQLRLTKKAEKTLVEAAECGLGENFRFPAVMLDSLAATQINQQVKEITLEIQANQQSYSKTDFYYSVHDDILSLILCIARDGESYKYLIWHVNIETGAPATTLQMLYRMGGDPAVYEMLANLRRKIEHYYAGTENLPADFPHHEMREKMLMELEDPDTAMRIYANDQGRLFWVCQLAAMGGAEFVEILMDPALPDAAYTPENQLTGNWDMLA